MENRISLKDVVEIIYADKNNAFFYENNGFVALKLTLPYSQEQIDKIDEEDKRISEDEERIKAEDEKSGHRHHRLLKITPDYEISQDKSTVVYTYKKVVLHRAFPYENPYEYISVLNTELDEICMIKNIEDCNDPELIKKELNVKYYEPIIKKIIEFKDDKGFSNWVVDTENGRRSFIVRDTFGSITHVTENYIYLTDIDGNRYVIEDLSKLDRNSYKKIELFL